MKKLPKCPSCKKLMTPIYNNNGFQVPGGQEQWEIVEFYCEECNIKLDDTEVDNDS